MTCHARLGSSLLLLGLLACRGEEVAFDCENQAELFEAATQSDAVELLEPVPPGPPYALALHLSEDGLNRLLDSIVDQTVPFAGDVPFGILPQGPGEAAFEVEDEPRIIVREVDNCPNCVVYSFNYRVVLDVEGDTVSTGSGFADMAIPLSLRADPETGSTTLVADYQATIIDDWSLRVFGFNSEEHDSLAGAVRRLLQEEIQEGFGAVDLLTLGSWQVGQGEVQALARELVVSPGERKVVLAMAANLPIAGEGVDLQAPVPEGVPMMVSIDDAVMLSMTQRMFTEGEIDRRYDERGQPNAEGLYGVDVTTIEPLTETALRTEFRVWRVADGYCGKAAVDMPLDLAIEQGNGNLVVDAGAASLIEGHPDNEGVGVAAEEDEQLVEDNQALVDTFRQQLTGHLRSTLNFKNLAVEGKRVVFTAQDVQVGSSIDVLLDFVVYALE